MFVKICGITRREDAEAAVACGASAVGFVFWPNSPRFIEPERALGIVRGLPPTVKSVGVFVNQALDEVNSIGDSVGLSVIQLHGDENVEFARNVRRPVIKAVSAGNHSTVVGWPEDVMVLVDAHDPIRRGGTGQSADWVAAATLARQRRVLLAGGLTAENVVEAISLVQPFGIDVSSGVESAPGVKDQSKIEALFRAVRGQVRVGAPMRRKE